MSNPSAEERQKTNEQLFNPSKPPKNCAKVVQNPFKTLDPSQPSPAKNEATLPPFRAKLFPRPAQVMNTLFKQRHNKGAFIHRSSHNQIKVLLQMFSQ